MDSFGTIRLDLDQLVAARQIDRVGAQRLQHLQLPDGRANLLISTLAIIGALAAAGGVVALKPAAITGLVIAIICLTVGQLLLHRTGSEWKVLAQTLGIGAAAGLTGWFAMEFHDTFPAIAINGFATATIAGMSLLFRSRFLAALIPVGIGSMIGSGGAYWHAAYAIYVREAAITIALFTPLAAALYAFSRSKYDSTLKPLAMVAGRMSLVMANFGWWVGSLWGNRVGAHFMNGGEGLLRIDDTLFALGWAGFAAAMIVIGGRLNQRFIQISGIVFLAINAFTQYFEFFKDEPVGLIIGGVLMVATAVGLVRWQMRRIDDAMPA